MELNSIQPAAGANTLTKLAAPYAGRVIGANDKIVLGFVGVGGQGGGAHVGQNLEHYQENNVALAAVCDISKHRVDDHIAKIEKKTNVKPEGYEDFRRLLERKDIDVVFCATVDHWHTKVSCEAMDAGKHVYVEKPIANTIEECQIMVKAQERYGKIVQVGQWQRSGSQYDEAIQYVKSGKLGQIRLVKCWAYQGWMKPVPVVANGPVPAGVDYNMWLGPAPKREFNANRFHFNFRWFWDYAGGLMTDWGVHEIDIALYAMGVSAPKSVMASGGKFAYPDDASETPDTLQTVYEYDGFNMLWEHATGIDGGNYGTTEGIAFIGNNATLVVNRGGWKVIPETENINGQRKPKVEEVPHTRPAGPSALDLHAVNFVEAMTANDPKLLKCAIQTGSVAAINAQMGNIAYKTGKKVYWDAVKNQFTDSEANQLMKANYHNGWQVPKV